MHHHALRVCWNVRWVWHKFAFFYLVYKSVTLFFPPPFIAILTEGSMIGCASECPINEIKIFLTLKNLEVLMLPHYAGMYTITWVENMRMWWRSWWQHCAPLASPSSGWDPARWCWSGLSWTVSASTLSCGPPSSSPWSLLLLLRLVCGGDVYRW